MKITRAAVSPLTAPLIMPFRVATGTHASLDNLLLTITLSDGTKGYGEAAVATHITGETIPRTRKNLMIAADYLKGQDLGGAFAMAAYVQSIFTDNMAAVAAVEMALLDALTRSLRIPLWRLWGSRPKTFATDITLVVGSLEETTAKARDFYERGFRSFKIKVGRDVDLDINRVIAVSRITRNSSLLLDANQGYDAAKTLRVLKILKRHGVRLSMVEQPVAKDDWEGLKKVTRSTDVLVCADESVGSLKSALRAISERAIGAINIKFMKTGILHAAHIARLANAGGIKLMIGGMMESKLAMTASAHLAAGMGCVDFIDLDTPFFIKDGLKKHPCLDGRGHYDLRRIKTGIGIIP